MAQYGEFQYGSGARYGTNPNSTTRGVQELTDSQALKKPSQYGVKPWRYRPEKKA
jgi:hypothetical protein